MEKEIKARWKTYFQDLLTTSVTADQSNPLEATYLNQADIEEELEEEPPDILDIEMAIQSMNDNKSPDIDNIPAEKGGGLLLNPLNAELNPICHLLVLLGDLTFMGLCIVSIFQYTGCST
jgi:hypothetical protein